MKCPKCQYERRATDTAPDYECPSCGVVYAKYDPVREVELNALRAKMAKSAHIIANDDSGKVQPASLEKVGAAQSVDIPSKHDLDAADDLQRIPGNVAVCKNCEEIGQVTEKMPGNGWVEIVLYLFWIAPGIVYSVWRRKSKKQVCGSCGSDQLVAAKTRAGQQIIAAQISSFKIAKNEAQFQTKKPTFGKLTAGLLGFFAATFLAQGVVMFIMGYKELAFSGILLSILCGVGCYRIFVQKPTRIESNGKLLIEWK